MLIDYEPNKSFYLPASTREALHERCAPGSFNCKDPAQAQQMRRFMADISHHSALLEGVRANYIDTVALLEDNIQSRRLSEEDAIVCAITITPQDFLPCKRLPAWASRFSRVWTRCLSNTCCDQRWAAQ